MQNIIIKSGNHDFKEVDYRESLLYRIFLNLSLKRPNSPAEEIIHQFLRQVNLAFSKILNYKCWNNQNLEKSTTWKSKPGKSKSWKGAWPKKKIVAIESVLLERNGPSGRSLLKVLALLACIYYLIALSECNGPLDRFLLNVLALWACRLWT
jgi:hypothetical protein